MKNSVRLELYKLYSEIRKDDGNKMGFRKFLIDPKWSNTVLSGVKKVC